MQQPVELREVLVLGGRQQQVDAPPEFRLQSEFADGPAEVLLHLGRTPATRFSRMRPSRRAPDSPRRMSRASSACAPAPPTA